MLEKHSRNYNKRDINNTGKENRDYPIDGGDDVMVGAAVDGSLDRKKKILKQKNGFHTGKSVHNALPETTQQIRIL